MIKYLAAMQMDRVLIMCESTSLPFFDKGRREPLRDDKVENFYSLCGKKDPRLPLRLLNSVIESPLFIQW